MFGLKSFAMALVCAVTSVSAVVTVHQAQAATINNMPADSSVGFFGTSYQFIAQSFISPISGSNQNISLDFQLSDMNTSNANDVLFSVLLTETTGAGDQILPGATLGDSGALALTSDCIGDQCSVSFNNLSLTNGSTYAWILAAMAGTDYGSIGSRAADTYAGGHYFSTSVYAGAWADTLGSDLAFNINIVSASPVPVPAALPLLLSGLAGLGLLGRRNRK